MIVLVRNETITIYPCDAQPRDDDELGRRRNLYAIHPGTLGNDGNQGNLERDELRRREARREGGGKARPWK